MERIDHGWLARNPVPEMAVYGDKNERGRVLIIGGGTLVPGALLLAGEAALRAGAGKLRLATVGAAAMPLAIAMPEAAVFALPADEAGDISDSAAETLAAASARCDAIVVGPGMIDEEKAIGLLTRLLDRTREGLALVLDAACIGALPKLREVMRLHEDRVVVTPHFGEMARLLDKDMGDVQSDPSGLAQQVAAHLGVTVVLKSEITLVASPDGGLCEFVGQCPGLATSGSGDVLAGIIGGLLARGAEPHLAASWGVWLHGEAGRLLTERHGGAGFLAREIPPEIPRLATLPAAMDAVEVADLHRRSS